MNGAITGELWPNIINPPKIIIKKITGISQNFFLTKINLKNSKKKDILIIKTDPLSQYHVSHFFSSNFLIPDEFVALKDLFYKIF